MQQTTSNNKLSFKTSIIPVAIILLLVVVPMLVLWAYGGEFNESHNNWLVAANGKFWGIGTDGSYGFWKNSGNLVTSYEPYLISVCIFIFANVVYITLAWFRVIKMSSFNFLNGTWLMLFVLIVSGLLYPKNASDTSWIIIVRCIVTILGFAFGWFVSSLILSKVLVNTKLGQEYALLILDEETKAEKYVKENISPYKHDLKQHKKKTYVTIKNKTKPKK